MGKFSTLFLSLAVGFFVRLACFAIFDANPQLANHVSQRVEISTPTSSWKATEEGIYLLNHGYSPYANNIFHSSPLYLQFFAFLTSHNIPYLTNLFFILIDMLVSFNLFYIARHMQSYLLKHKVFEYEQSYEANDLTTSLHSSRTFDVMISCLYNLNPLVIAVCVSKSNSNICHALVSSAIVLAMSFDFDGSKSRASSSSGSSSSTSRTTTHSSISSRARNGRIVMSAFILALASVLDVYALMLVPVCIQFLAMDAAAINTNVLRTVGGAAQASDASETTGDDTDEDQVDTHATGRRIKVCVLYIVAYLIALVFFFNYNIIFLQEKGEENGSQKQEINWHFLKEFYFFMFEGNDCLPNIGPWWYVRLQMFPQFLSFFTVVLQSQPLIFVLAYMIRFADYPHISLYLIIHCYQTFRVYPTISDTMFGLVLYVAVSSILTKYMKHLIPLGMGLITSVILMYFEWYMWIDAGIGNANFYYGANLFYVLCNLYLVTASIAAARQYIYHKQKDEKASLVSSAQTEESDNKADKKND